MVKGWIKLAPQSPHGEVEPASYSIPKQDKWNQQRLDTFLWAFSWSIRCSHFGYVWYLCDEFSNPEITWKVFPPPDPGVELGYWRYRYSNGWMLDGKKCVAKNNSKESSQFDSYLDFEEKELAEMWIHSPRPSSLRMISSFSSPLSLELMALRSLYVAFSWTLNRGVGCGSQHRSCYGIGRFCFVAVGAGQDDVIDEEQ